MFSSRLYDITSKGKSKAISNRTATNDDIHHHLDDLSSKHVSEEKKSALKMTETITYKVGN